MSNTKTTNKQVKIKAQGKEQEKKEEQKPIEQANNLKITAQIDRLINIDESKVKAFANATIGDAFAVHGIRVMESDKGLYVSMPYRSYNKNGKTEYSDVFHPITSEAREQLNNAVLKAYEQKLEQSQTEGQTQGIEEEPVMEQQQ